MQRDRSSSRLDFHSIRFLVGAGAVAVLVAVCSLVLFHGGRARPGAPEGNPPEGASVSSRGVVPPQAPINPTVSAKTAPPAAKLRKTPRKLTTVPTAQTPLTATVSSTTTTPGLKLPVQNQSLNPQTAQPDGNKNGFAMQPDGGNALGETGDDPKNHASYFYGQRAYPNAHTPAGARQNALAQRDSMIAQQRALGLLPAENAAAPPPIGFPEPSTWTNIGPQPVTNSLGAPNFGSPAATGRVTAIAVDPNLPSTIYLGAATGGVWKSTNSGASWTTIFDQNNSLAIGGIAIAPSSGSSGTASTTLYVGTGENNFSGDSYYGAGIYMSTNGGTSWTQECAGSAGGVAVNFCAPIGPFAFQGGGFIVGEIAVNPSNPQIADAAVVNFSNNSQSGIYRTTNGGTLWTLIPTASGAAGNTVAWDPVTPTIVFATLGGFSGTGAFGVYKSIDSGATFSKVTGNGAVGNNLPTTNLGRHELAIAPSNGTTVYVVIHNINSPTSDLLGLAKSTDAGVTWSFTTPGAFTVPGPDAVLPNFCHGQCWYDMSISVDPLDPNTVIVGGSAFTNNSSTVFRSSDGGTTWTDITNGSTSVRPHVDTHALTFANLGGGAIRLYDGNDGGVWFTDTPTAALSSFVWQAGNNASLTVTQFYPGLSTHPTDINISYGGTQDNGTEKYSGILAWDHITCGDGGWTAVDPIIPSTVYAACQNIQIERSSLDGSAPSWVLISNEVGASGDRSLFIPPLVHDPQTSGTLYFGTFRVWQTVNYGNNWTAISPDLTGGSLNDAVTSVSVSSANNNVVYATTTNGLVWMTANANLGAGATWTNITKSPLPGRYATMVRTDDSNPDIAYLSYSGFSGFTDSVGHVFMTSNGGTTWTDISGSGAGALPNAPVNDIQVQQIGAPLNLHDLFIATDVGVFQCSTPSATPACSTWTPLTGLPAVPVVGLDLRSASQDLRAVTHGRGVWDMLAPDISPTGLLLVTSITPSDVAAGSGPVTLTFLGNDFGVPSGTPEVFVNGVLDTGVTNITVLSPNMMTATLPATDTANPQLLEISIFQPGHAASPQNPTSQVPFGVTGPAPTLVSIAPTQMAANSSSFPMTLTGSNFECGTAPARTIVQFGSSVLNTSACTSGSLTVTVPTNLISAPGAVTVTTYSPGPGGGLSGGQTFTVTAAAIVGLAPSPVPFGSQQQGTTSAAMTVTVTNTGASSATLAASTPVTITGTNPSDFAIVPGTTTCVAGFVLAATTGSCVINVTFTPGGTGARTATLNVADSAPGSPQTDTLNGTGTASSIGFSLTPVPFGNQVEGTTSAPMTITVSNTGNASATLAASTPVTISGTNASDFAIVPGTTTCVGGFVLVANTGSCVVNVTFTPGGTGARTATLNVADNASGSPQTDTLNGTGTIAAVGFAPSPVPFGNQPQGTTSSAVTITVSNTGTAAATLAASTPVTITGTNASDFAIVPGTTTCVGGVVLVANTGSCVVNVTFTPGATGARTATLNVADNGPGSPQTDTLNGTGTIAAIGLAPSPVPFGNQPRGTTGSAVTITVSNTGTAAATLAASTPVTITGTNATDFAIVPGTTTCVGGFVLAANTGSCVVNMTFTPGATGARTATLNIADNGPGSPQTDTLNGTGTVAAIGFAPSPVPFGNQVQGTTGSAVTITVSNTGTAAATLAASTPVTISGTNAGDFAIVPGTTTCVANFVLVANTGSCVVNVTFTPGATGARTATLNVADNGPGSPQTDTLNGTGTIAAIGFAPSPVPFGSQQQGTTSSAVTITVSNTGTAAATLAASTPVTITGTNATDFAIVPGTTTCVGGFVLVANTGSCVVNVTFTPGATGARTATLNVADNGPGSPQTDTLNGTGTTSSIGFNPSPVPFGGQVEGTTSAAMTVTVTNTGAASATLAASTPVTITGTNPSDFAIVPGTTTCVASFVLVANTGSCVVNVTFTPGATGARTATLNVADSAPGSPQSDTLNGTGTLANVGLAPSPVPFGNQVQGTTGSAVTITVSNTGTAAATLAASTPVTITGTNPTDFAIVPGTTTCVGGFVLVANTGSCVINVTFTPGATGARTATINVADNAPGSPQTDTLNGTGTLANVGLATLPLQFGNQPQGTTSAAMTITVSNTGTAAATLAASTPVTITGTNPTDFAIVPGTTTCVASFVLVANTGSCVVNVTFTPSATGARTATINLADNAPNSPQTGTLNGTGTIAAIGFAPSPAPFGSQPQGTTSSAVTITVSNTGTAAATLAASNPVTITGANATDFAIVPGTTTCVASFVLVANTGSCVINVTFTPSATGARTATLNVADNGPGSPQTDTLNGTGTIAAIGFAPSPVPFGNQPQGTTSTAMTITVSNTGTAPATLAAATPVTITGANATDFAIVPGTTTCVTSFVLVANTGSCVVNVTFTPGATGARTATLNVADNGPSSPQTDTLNGTGTAAAIGFVPSPAPFGNQRVGTTSGSVTVTVTNTGNQSATLAAGTPVTVTGTNASDFAIVPGTTTCVTSFVLVANTGSCVVNLTFTPGAAGARTATLNVADNGPGSPQTDILNGTGTIPNVTLAPSPVPFGNVNLGSANQMTVTVTNTGTAPSTLAAANAVTITGANASDFATAAGTTCVASFVLTANGGSCIVNIAFTPGALLGRTAVLGIADDAPGSPQTDTLNGTGTQPGVNLSTLNVPFGTVDVSVTTAAPPITLTNSGTGPLTFTSFVINGADPGDFLQVNTCPVSPNTLAAGANCSITPSIKPATTGARAANLVITDSAPSSPQTITLGGTGVDFSVSGGAATDTVAAGQPANFTITLTPAAGGFPNAITFTATGLPGATSVSFNPPSVTPGAAATPTTMTITTTARSNGLPMRTGQPPLRIQYPFIVLWSLATAMLLFLLIRMRRTGRKRLAPALYVAVVLMAAVGIVGCTNTPTGTPAGTSTITVTATSGSLSHNTTVTLTVQ